MEAGRTLEVGGECRRLRMWLREGGRGKGERVRKGSDKFQVLSWGAESRWRREESLGASREVKAKVTGRA